MSGLNQVSDNGGVKSPNGESSPNSLNSLMSSAYSKIGTRIPNRIFVGGLPSNATEAELKSHFSTFGPVKDVKIINDRSGLSKGLYGFVTFENQEVAENIINTQSESLMFKDRKLNIGPAIRKQTLYGRPDVPVFLTNGTVPYAFSNGIPIFSLPGPEYALLSQTPNFAPVIMPQTVYLPQAQAPYAYQALPPNTNNQLSSLQQLEQWQAAASGVQAGNAIPSNILQGPPANNFDIASNQQAWRWVSQTAPQTPQVVYAPRNGPDVQMCIHQTSTHFTPNSTSDYSTDMEHESSPRRSTQENIYICNSNESLKRMNASSNNSKLYATQQPAALLGHQMVPASPAALKRGFTAYACTQVLQAPPGLTHFNKNTCVKELAKN